MAEPQNSTTDSSRLSQFDYANLSHTDSMEGLPALESPSANLWTVAGLRALLPGLSTALMIALSALFLAQHYLAPAVFFALLLGLAVNFLAKVEPTRLGLDFAAKNLLRTGIAISGAQLTFQEIATLGYPVVVGIVAVVAVTFALGIGLSRLFSLSREFGILAGGAVAICGASAALAVSSVLPKSETLEQNTILVIISVATLSSLAMIGYPILALQLGLGDIGSGLFFGGSIHDVAQVLGAGYAVSDDAGEVATVTKLLRVALLFPIVSLISLWVGARQTSARASIPKVPSFLLIFLLVVAANSFHLIPQPVGAVMSDAARFFLIMAVAALGIKTSLEALKNAGWRPLLVLSLQTVLMAAMMLGLVLILA